MAKNPWPKIILAMLEGVLYAWGAILLLWLTLPAGAIAGRSASAPCTGGLFCADFARRWDGTCSGWTRDLALVHVVSDLLLWTAYVVIAAVLTRLHPILHRVPSSRITLPMMVLIFTTCGATHLFAAYAVFNPLYRAIGIFNCIAAAVGLVGGTFIAHNLVTAFAIVRDEQAKIRLMAEQLDKQKGIVGA